jgi:hypothetical protein
MRSVSTPKNFFDISKHGYTSFHGLKYNPTGAAWDGTAILQLDPYDKTSKKRGTSKRSERLALDLYEYLE